MRNLSHRSGYKRRIHRRGRAGLLRPLRRKLVKLILKEDRDLKNELFYQKPKRVKYNSTTEDDVFYPSIPSSPGKSTWLCYSYNRICSELKRENEVKKIYPPIPNFDSKNGTLPGKVFAT